MKTAHRVLSLALALLLTVGLLQSAPAGLATEDESPFKSSSVTLHSALTVNFKVAVEDTENAAMTFQVSGNTGTRTVKVTEAKKEGDLYSFPCPIGAVQMTDTITATLTDSGKTYTKTETVKNYVERLLEKQDWHMLAANPMALSTLHYGSALQIYAEHRTGDLADSLSEKYPSYAAPAQPKPEDIANRNPASLTDNLDGITCTGASLMLRSNVAVRFYFTVETGTISDYTFTIGDQTYTPTKSGEKYFVEYNQINPQDYETVITMTVTKSGGDGSIVINYCPMHYISTTFNKYTANTEKQALCDLLGRMYQYYLAAKDYSPVGNHMDNVVNAQ